MTRLQALSEDLADLEEWLRDRYDAAEDGKNDEARHWDTVQRVRAELARIGRGTA